VSEREAPADLARVVGSALSDSGPWTHELSAPDPQTGLSETRSFRIVPIPGEQVGDGALGAVAFRASDDSTESLPDGLLADLARLWGLNSP
jgi:hypothetical protein